MPYQTLLDKLKNKHANPAWHATVLTKEEEQLVVKWIYHMAGIGFPVIIIPVYCILQVNMSKKLIGPIVILNRGGTSTMHF